MLYVILGTSPIGWIQGVGLIGENYVALCASATILPELSKEGKATGLSLTYLIIKLTGAIVAAGTGRVVDLYGVRYGYTILSIVSLLLAAGLKRLSKSK